MKIRTFFACLTVSIAMTGLAQATAYQLPPIPGDSVITQYPDGIALTQAQQDETLLDVARQFLLGQTEVVRLNPEMDRWKIKKGEIVRLPNQRILPDTPHRGITLNLPEYRMYVYPPDQPGTVLSFAHGVGRQDWKTPLGMTRVTRKVQNPSWYPPESIRREHAAMGDPLPAVVPPGPHNPLGLHALYLALPGDYRIHGTDVDKIYGIGMQITHGCVRMYPEDIEQLYNLTPVGTPVYIVKQPIKVGWLENVLYIEAHPDLEGEDRGMDQRYSIALELIQKANNDELPDFDQRALNDALAKLDGDPHPIYERLPPLEGEFPINQPEQTLPPLPLKKAAENKAEAPKPAAIKKAAPKPTATKKTVTASKTKTPPKTALKTPAKKVSSSQGKGSSGGYYHGN